MRFLLITVQADEMAKTFRQRVAQAEAAARAEELRLQQEVLETILPKDPSSTAERKIYSATLLP